MSTPEAIQREVGEVEHEPLEPIRCLAAGIDHVKDLGENGFGRVERSFVVCARLPSALEGAFKIKGISYIHAEAYPAGELKHGPLALVTSACSSTRRGRWS